MASIIQAENEFEELQLREKSEFLIDLQVGLAQPRKHIQSKYFYDDQGSELFNQITRHPDYYLTRCEIEILNLYKQEIAAICNSSAFNLVELGPGEGLKTHILVDEFLREKLDFSYIPIDISKQYIKNLIKDFSKKLNSQQLTPLYADYFRGLEWLSANTNKRNVVLFLGSSIGNFTLTQTEEFLKHLSTSLNKGDYLLLGLDLRKDVEILMQAYSDNAGITRNFNLNLLRRINREFNADFDLNKFQHYAAYNVYAGAMESYLLSMEEQTIIIGDLNQSYNFEESEPIHVECSQKFSLKQINELAKNTGFEIVKHYTDTRRFFTDTLWRVK